MSPVITNNNGIGTPFNANDSLRRVSPTVNYPVTQTRPPRGNLFSNPGTALTQATPTEMVGDQMNMKNKRAYSRNNEKQSAHAVVYHPTNIKNITKKAAPQRKI